jgi:hypothetical protein
VDDLGNAGAWTTLFTFRYDVSAPTNPISTTETHGAPDDTWQNTVDDPAFTWSGASDGSGSGIDRYYIYWGNNPAGTSSYWTTGTSYDPSAVDPASTNYLRGRTVDVAGNASLWTTWFTFRYETTVFLPLILKAG